MLEALHCYGSLHAIWDHTELPDTRQRQYLLPLPSHNKGWYSIYPPITDERLSRPEPMRVNDLPKVTTEVPAIRGINWLSWPSAPLGTAGVNNLPTVVTQ